MTDILLPLGAGSRYKNRELRYCLRSIEKHLTGVRNVWVVGERPEWLRNVVHVPCQDNPSNWMRARNIYDKIMAGVNANVDCAPGPLVAGGTLSDTFLFMNDDHYLLADYEAANFPYYHRGQMRTDEMKGNQPQLMQYENTLGVLGNYALDYGVHCPLLIEKEQLRYAMPPNRWPAYGYEIKSMFANLVNVGHKLVAPADFCEDLKFKEPAMKESIYRALEGRKWFSIGDRCLRSPGQMFEVLEELYPTTSKYEA